MRCFVLNEIKIKIPQEIQAIIEMLEKNNHTAYIVGGCVRDAVLGKIPNDYDLCTSATPEQMKEILNEYDIYDTGIKHGTVTVAGLDDKYEITTYRIDGIYSDNRRPENVAFVKNVEPDLARRDFTINAMAYNKTTGLVDPFNGIEDVKNKLIRCVGDADKRFQEDALRILRAIRFASTYGFKIENKTEEAIHRNKHLLSKISEERKTSEFCKLLLTADAELLMKYKDIFAEFIPEIKPMFGFDQKTKWHCYDVYEHTVQAVSQAPKDIIVRLSLFFHDIGKPETFTKDEKGGHFYGHPIVSEEITERIMRRMRFDKTTMKNVLQLILNHDNKLFPSKKCARKLLRNYGEEQAKRLIIIQECDKGAQSQFAKQQNYQSTLDIIRDYLDDAIANKECFTLRDLAINGNDLKDMGIKGPLIGKTLNALLDIVIKNPVINNKDTLLGFAKNMSDIRLEDKEQK